MNIAWMALLVVGIVSVVSTAVFALLLALSVRLMYPHRGAPKSAQVSAAATRTGWALLVLIGLLIALGIWLIVPHFH